MFLHINKLGHKCEDLPPMVLNSPGSRASESSELAAETDEPEAAAAAAEQPQASSLGLS